MAHRSQLQLREALEEANQQVEVGGLYYHYKHPDRHYRVTELVVLEATDAVGVVYRVQYGERIGFVRPLSSWLDVVEVGGARTPRFTKVS